MKKAQMTVFIVAGLLILLTVIAIIIIMTRTIDKDLVPKLDDVPDEFVEMQRFVLECARETAEEGLIQIGEHGGYIDPLDATLTGKSFDLGAIPTASDVVYFNPYYPVPYWWYLKTPIDCVNCEVSDEHMPSIAVLEDQINRYVNHQLEDCLGDFEQFREQSIVVTSKGEVATRSVIGEEHVAIYVEYPFEVSRGEISTTMSNFPVDIDIKFREIYTLAVAIALGEENTQFLETLLMHLISSYSDVKGDKLPPLTSIDEGFDIVMWTRTNVHTKLQDLLRSYVPVLQVENTANYQPIETDDSFQQALYDAFTLKSDIEYPDLEVNFLYLDWPIYFDITPRTGELLKPTITRREYPWGIAPLTQNNLYEFFYDVSFPVIVEIRNKEAIRGRGYSFLFALEGNVIDNKNLALWHMGEGTIGPYDYSKVEYSFGDLEDMEVIKYIPETGKTVNMTLKKPAKKLFCNTNQRLSGEIAVQVVDSYGSPVPDATVSFGCGKYTSCALGNTDTSGIYKGKFPICIGGGYVSLTKQGFAPAALSNLTIEVDKEESLRMTMKRLKSIDSQVRLINNNKVRDEDYLSLSRINDIRESGEELLERHRAIISLQKVKDDPFEEEYSDVIVLDGPNINGRISLVPGKYLVQGTLIDQEGFVINEHEEQIGIQKILIPKLEMKPSVLGGAVINHENGYWAVKPGNLDQQEVIFYMFYTNPPRDTKELLEINSFEKYSLQHRTVIEPEFR